MSDLSRHSRHEHLDEIKHIVAIGGGHGLGRVLSALSFMKERLTGIVTTTITAVQQVESVKNKVVLHGAIYVIA